MPAAGVPVELKTESSEALLCSLSSDGPVVYVVALEHLQVLRGLKDVVADFRERDRRQPLRRKLVVKCERSVKVIEGNYRKVGWLLQAIAKLLREAAQKGDHSRYIIGVGDLVFDELLEAAERAELAEHKRRKRPDPADVPGPETTYEVSPKLVEAFPGISVAAQRLRARMVHAVWHRREVLLVGETGTPLEAVAHDIDALRGRRARPFVTVDCRVNGDHSFELLLCGDTTPGNSGRCAAPGLLKRAEGGTLFIDAISELQPCHQAQLLHALERREMQTITGICVQMLPRIMVASRCDLEEPVKAGTFNAELYYRLRSFTIRIPSLRERPEDIALIARALWREITWNVDATLPYDVEQVLREHDWPGNHVQLESMLYTLHSWCRTRRPTAALVRVLLEDENAPPFDDPPRRPSRVRGIDVRPASAISFAAARRRRRSGSDD